MNLNKVSVVVHADQTRIVAVGRNDRCRTTVFLINLVTTVPYHLFLPLLLNLYLKFDEGLKALNEIVKRSEIYYQVSVQ